MIKIFLGLFMFLYLGIFAFGQTYGEKRLFKNFDRWIIESNGHELSMRAFITVQDILTIDNIEIKTNTLLILPKYRYEIYLLSTSTYNGKDSKIHLQSTRIFIDGVEVTRRQFPNGFNFLLSYKPTLIYWYETNKELIDLKITWSNVHFLKE